ncbi:hypothetical protein ASD77_15875 [Pseudoxanthomonas sp. Root65]|uniref:DUF6968 family protein n=1 Tax=Pseudoxanthomonas sp. Root65 TaxID=1736576 RepID=UPI0006F55596|nr:hypothetical protein [Pseudoxanthomonas sp. Root65]KRA51102.1 hypothetical protein ASD77_15875 [Pseudoxanthomonas sp. Root65]
MTERIAERSLQYAVRGGGQRKDLVIRIFSPFIVPVGSVNFEVDGVVAGCRWELEGLPEKVSDTTYGADSVQALQLAANIDGVLAALRDKYDFYFRSGEPYFED